LTLALSVLIPARNELFLAQTVADVLGKATGDVEVLVMLDNYWPDKPLIEDKRLRVLHSREVLGLRGGVNALAGIARGKYLLKCDAHCLFGEGYDEILTAECEDNWIVIPRRYSLEAETWSLKDKPSVDYEHYFYPYAHPEELGLHARPWSQRKDEHRDVLLDEDMSFQGSCWMMTAAHFRRLGGLDQNGYGTFMGEPQEIGLKTQLGPWGGAIMRNKKTYYAHLHKGKQYGRMYFMSQEDRVKGNAYSFDFWWNNRWTERAHDLEWLIDKFWPVPSWPENWRVAWS
jgi:glycosyltransferase involved in cell wall biosynthesis